MDNTFLSYPSGLFFGYRSGIMANISSVKQFHFGGSTHCLIFRPGVKLEFVSQAQNPGEHAENLPVCGQLATVISK